jgi:thiol-disulfide isomerase/thioredoxin
MSNNTSITKIIIALFVIIVVGFIVGSMLSSSSNNEAVITTESGSERASATNQATDTRTPSGGSLEAPADATVAAEDDMMEKDAMMKDDEMSHDDDMMKKDTMVSDETEVAVDPVVTTAAAGSFTDYDPALLANAESGDVVLFFHASWCPSCRALENDLNENLSEIPGDVTILQVDYDSATELKRQYGVVRQHTLVRVDADGNEIGKLTGLTNTLDQVLAQL